MIIIRKYNSSSSGFLFMEVGMGHNQVTHLDNFIQSYIQDNSNQQHVSLGPGRTPPKIVYLWDAHMLSFELNSGRAFMQENL